MPSTLNNNIWTWTLQLQFLGLENVLLWKLIMVVSQKAARKACCHYRSSDKLHLITYEHPSREQLFHRSSELVPCAVYLKSLHFFAVLNAPLWRLTLVCCPSPEKFLIQLLIVFDRTSSRCYRQATKLVVDEPVATECGRPRKANQMITFGVTDHVSCPLKDHIKKLDSYNISHSITWYKVSYCMSLSDLRHWMLS